MDLPARAMLVIVSLAVAGAAWALVRARRGRVIRVGGAEVPAVWADRLGSRLTLVQVSSEHCAACRRAANVWERAIAGVDGVVHVEVDAADHLDVVRDLGLLATPTTLVYDGDGVLRGRVTGAPTPRQAADAISTEPIGALR